MNDAAAARKLAEKFEAAEIYLRRDRDTELLIAKALRSYADQHSQMGMAGVLKEAADLLRKHGKPKLAFDCMACAEVIVCIPDIGGLGK